MQSEKISGPMNLVGNWWETLTPANCISLRLHQPSNKKKKPRLKVNSRLGLSLL